MKVIILTTQEGDWSSLFIENNVVFEGHRISSIELLRIADDYKFKAIDVQFGELNDEDEQIVATKGGMDGFINPNSYYDNENDY